MTGSPGRDEIFISKLKGIILANLDNESFGVRELSHESRLSQYVLTKRLNAITGKTISQFIREIRLKRAFELLQNEEYTASEVAYKAGFASSTYFNKCFHDYFGYPPGEVQKGGISNREPNPITEVTGEDKPEKWVRKTSILALRWILIIAIISGTGGFLLYKKIHKPLWSDDLTSSDGRISMVVMPFRNMTNDTIWDIWQEGIQTRLISELSEYNKELKVRQKDNINRVLQSEGLTKYSSVSPGVASRISLKLESNLLVYGSIEQAGSKISIDAQLISTKTEEVIKSFKTEGNFGQDEIFNIVDSLSQKLRDFLVLSKLIRKNPVTQQFYPIYTNSPEALKYFIYGNNATGKREFATARDWYLKALAVDSNFFDAALALMVGYGYEGNAEKNLEWVIKLHKKRDQMPLFLHLWTNWAYACNFESPEEIIKYLRQLQQIDDQDQAVPYLIGAVYFGLEQYDKAIPEFLKSIEIRRKWEQVYLTSGGAFEGLGYAYHKTGQYKKEKKLYRLAEKYFQDNPTITSMRAILALTKRDTIAAKRYVEKYITLSRKSAASEADIASGLAWIYSEADIPDRADEYYHKVISLEPDKPARLYDYAGFLITNNRNLDEVSGLMDKAMKLAQNKLDYYNYLETKGWGYYKEGKISEALEILQNVCDSAPFPMYEYKSHLEEAKIAYAKIK